MAIVQPVRLSENLKPLIDLKSKEEHISKSVIIRKFVYDKLEDYALDLCNRGRLSIGKAAELLDTSIYDLQEKAKKKGIILSASEEAHEESKKTVERLVKKLKR
jgi:predicted HTH domain antitoxin